MLECDQPLGRFGVEGFGRPTSFLLPVSPKKRSIQGHLVGLKDQSTPPGKINGWNLNNDGLEDDLFFAGIYSQVRAVNLPGCE